MAQGGIAGRLDRQFGDLDRRGTALSHDPGGFDTQHVECMRAADCGNEVLTGGSGRGQSQTTGENTIAIDRAGESDRVAAGQARIGAQRHRAGVSLAAAAADGAGVDGAGSADRQRGQIGDGIACVIAEYRVACDSQAMAAAGQRTLRADGAAGQRGVGSQAEAIAISLSAGRGHTAAIQNGAASRIGTQAGKFLAGHRAAQCAAKRRRAAVVDCQAAVAAVRFDVAGKADADTLQRGIRAQRHRAGVILRAAAGYVAGVDRGRAADRQGAQAGDAVADCIAEHGVTDDSQAMRAAGQRALRADGAAGQCGVCAQAGVFAIGLHAGRSNRSAVDFNRAAGIGGDARRRDGGLELGDAGAVDCQRAQRAIQHAPHGAGEGHRARAGVHGQIVGFRRLGIERAGEQDGGIGRRQRAVAAQCYCAAIGLCAAAADGVGVDDGGAAHRQGGEAGDGVRHGIAEHGVADDVQAMRCADDGTLRRDGAAGQRGVCPERQRAGVTLRTAAGDVAGVDRGGAADRQRGQAGDGIGRTIAKHGSADDIQAMASADQRALRRDAAAGQRAIQPQRDCTLINLRAGGRDLAAVDSAGAGDMHATKLALGRSTGRAFADHIGKHGIARHGQRLGRVIRTVDRRCKGDGAAGQIGVHAQRDRAGVILRAAAGDITGIDCAGAAHRQGGQASDGIRHAIAKHGIADDGETMCAAGQGA